MATVAVAAHHGLDAAELTSFLVERLRHQGLEARWTADAEAGHALRCVVERLEVGVADTTLVGEARLGCALELAAWTAHGHFFGHLPQRSIAGDLVLGKRRVQEMAVRDALEQIARGGAARHWSLDRRL